MVEIPSGTQDGRAVEDLLRRMHLRPLGGSGWKVVVVNEADRMTPQAEVMWLDGLEKLPAKVVVALTTNDLDVIPQDLGRFEKAGDEYSIGLALQQIAPYLRTGDLLPASFAVPIVRDDSKPKRVPAYGSTTIAEFAASKNGQRNRG